MTQLAWLMPILPLLAFVVTGLFTGRSKNVTIGIVLAAFVANLILATGIGIEVLGGAATMTNPIEYGVEWLRIGDFVIECGVLIDPLTATMLFVVMLVATLVGVYSIGYMHGDPGTPRFFSYLALFVFSMLLLVVSNNYFFIFFGWELVGLCSYLLIGYYYDTDSAARASQKAFLFNRLADFGFMLGFFLIFAVFGTFNFTELSTLIPAYGNKTLVAIMGLLVFVGPIGKSAQFPLHVWLPDAMEGPTPVSALIHAATMVAAGVYLLARQFALFSSSELVLNVITFVGGFTAIFAACMALVNNDIKRVLAFSTMSQLGYMVMAIGLGTITAATFHLGTHAFFKALLFLGAGSVIHCVGSNDMAKMGGLRKYMPVTTVTFIIGSLALAGIFPLAGFWSKDEIITVAYTSGHYGYFILAELVAFMTAFYMFRLIFRTFFGENHTDADRHLHESPKVMTVPLIILAFFAIFSGFVGAPFMHNGYASYVFYGEAHHPEANWFVIFLSTALALGGIFLAYLMYYKKSIDPAKIAKASGPVYGVLANRFYIDEIYQWIFDMLVMSFSYACKWVDTYIIDGFLDCVANATKWIGAKLRKTENGNLQTYALVMFFAVLVMVLWQAMPMLGGM